MKKLYLSLIVIFITFSCGPTYKLSTTETKKNQKAFTFLGVNNEEFNTSKINDIIFNKIQTYSKYGVFKPIDNNTDIQKAFGVYYEKNASDIIISYSNGEYYRTLSAYAYSAVRFKFNIDFKQIPKGITVTITEAPSADISLRKKAFGGYYELLDNIDNLKSDCESIFSQLNLAFKYSYKDSGEFNVPFKDDAVYGNFDRLLKRNKLYQASKIDIQKKILYDVQYNGKEIMVYISVYPYRDGSKVVYEVECPYILKSDGTNDYNSEDIKVIIDKIKKIAND